MAEINDSRRALRPMSGTAEAHLACGGYNTSPTTNTSVRTWLHQ